ncbi:hypothetical protein CC1G_09324 [Coprinopsis cinerea okayama7|uniref:Uncharacterized protein n=1 Tax=Coprinopsis cinerea (strain Okayama-7 / 130 / ATCC MYA-4618 / FGSC 9003) TaxID=240176 RepID=A8N5L9_COPC7|nr:hypothetical protein CC1G_09324 [Coprinopsis cinerea okayama7\|eukprot:XP_001830164.1 hypothetical protein CC1G_09324 [Coprinopsis cinerea okayama7\
MNLLSYFYYSSTSQTATQSKDNVSTETTVRETAEHHSGDAVVSVTTESEVKTTTVVVEDVPDFPKPKAKKRVSFRQAISLTRVVPQVDKGLVVPAPSAPAEAKPVESKHRKERISRADRRAKKSAQRLQSLIVGEASTAIPAVTPVVAKARLDKIKSQLSRPKTGNKVIAELRRLPVGEADLPSEAPIHAVCLAHTDAEEDCLHFAKLKSENGGALYQLPSFSTASLTTAPVEKLAEVLNDLQVVDLLQAPDLGLGQPGDGKGLLAGAVPTPETVLNGVKQITPQLMALGRATGRMIQPDHRGVYPPTDRFSVLTYWWGLEVLMPPPTLEYLATAQSIAASVVNFLSAMALVHNGIREILPLVRYIAQYIEIEYASIKAQDKGKGVVCAATWLMPAALVPRPWDFPDPPASTERPQALAQVKDDDGSKSPYESRPISSMLDIVTPAVSVPSVEA